MVQRAVLLLCVAALDIAAASPGELLDNGSLAERLASTETVVDQLLSMMEALQEQIAGDERAQKEEARVRRKLSGSTETGYLCLLYTSPSPRDKRQSRMPSSA